MTLRCVVRCVVLVIAETRDWQTVATKKLSRLNFEQKLLPDASTTVAAVPQGVLLKTNGKVCH